MRRTEGKTDYSGVIRMLSVMIAGIIAVATLINAVPIGASTSLASGYIVLGDVNGDGLLSTTDLTRLMKLIAGMDVEVEPGTEDVNFDGAVNAADLTRLMKYIAQGTTETLPLPEIGGDTDTDAGTDSDHGTESAPEEQDPPVYGETLSLIEGGEFTLKRIVYGTGYADYEETAAKQLKEKLESLAVSLGVPDGATLKTVSTRTGAGRQYNVSDIEIYVGYVTHPEVNFDGLKYGDYSIKMVGNKIVVTAYATEAMDEAIAQLEKIFEAACNKANGNLVLQRDGFDKTVTVDSMLSFIPIFEGGGTTYNFKVGNGAKEIFVKSVTEEQYNKYLEKLDKTGFSEVNSSVLGNNKFSVQNLLGYTINVGYYGNTGTVRVILEPLVEQFALKSDNIYTSITTPQITELGVSYKKSNGDMVNNGLCVILRLCDGRFIIIDGGVNTSTNAKQILSELKRQSSAYAKSESDITVAAWIITHAHNDHAGVITGKTSTFKNINVENVIINYAHADEQKRGIATSLYWFDNEDDYENKVISAAKTLGAKVRITHPGSTYYFADAKIETLHTADSHNYSVPLSFYNSTSVVMKITIGNTVYMSLGDATDQVLGACSQNYGDFMKADVVQLAHHGLGHTKEVEATVIKAYEYMSPRVVFWPVGLESYEKYKDKLFNLAATSPEYNPNISEVLVSGQNGTRITISVPYDPSKTEIVR